MGGEKHLPGKLGKKVTESEKRRCIYSFKLLHKLCMKYSLLFNMKVEGRNQLQFHVAV